MLPITAPLLLLLLGLVVALALRKILPSHPEASALIGGALYARRVGPIVLWLAAAVGIYLTASFPVFWWTGLMLPITAPLLFLLLGLVVALTLRDILPSPPEVPAP